MTYVLSRRFLLAAAPALAFAGPALAARPVFAPLTDEQKAAVAQATAYLEGLNEAQGRFIQTSPRGAITRGDLYIKRPGKARFAYDLPSGLLVVSDGYNVSVYDQRLKTFDQYPLSATPLSLFLARQIRLDKGVVISRVERSPSGFSITARDGRKEAEGQVTLAFSTGPLALREWALTDAQGQVTRVAVESLRPASLDKALFVLRDPRPRMGSGSGK